MSLLQRLRDRQAGLLRGRPLLPSGARWLEQQEDGERVSAKVAAARPAQPLPNPPHYRLSSLVPGAVSSYVFLGFSKSASYVWSYRIGDDSRAGEDSEWFYLQAWLWRQERPLVLLLNQPFYRWHYGHSFLEDENDHPIVVVLESDDDSCVVVYAYKRPQPRGEQCGTYHFAILPLPKLPLPHSTQSPVARDSGSNGISVASHCFTSDCQWDEVPRIPVSLHVVPESASASAGRYLLLVQTSTAINCMRFDVINGGISTTAPNNMNNSPSSFDNSSSATSSLLHFRCDSRVFGSHSWTAAHWLNAVNENSVQWRIKVQEESSFDIERLISTAGVFRRMECRVNNYHIANLNVNVEASQLYGCAMMYALTVLSFVLRGEVRLHFIVLCIDFASSRFSWRLLDWTAEQLERFQLPAEFHVKNATAQLDIRQIPDSLAADGLPRYCLGSSRSFSDSSREARSLMLHTALLGREIREKLRVQLPLRDKTSNEPHNLAVIAGQSKVELCHPAGTAVIVL